METVGLGGTVDCCKQTKATGVRMFYLAMVCKAYSVRRDSVLTQTLLKNSLQ